MSSVPGAGLGPAVFVTPMSAMGPITVVFLVMVLAKVLPPSETSEVTVAVLAMTMLWGRPEPVVTTKV